MTPADKRVMDLLERWLTSIELHLRYANLDEARYRQVQPWPSHERPARWILELAQQKVLQLKTLCKARLVQNDPGYAESLEIMCFLANLVGAEHVQRFIPLADPTRENQLPPTDAATSADSLNATAGESAAPQTNREPVAISASVDSTIKTPIAARVVGKVTTSTADAADSERTREMPRMKPSSRRALPKESPTAKLQHAATAKNPANPTITTTPVETTRSSGRLNDVVVADAVRLLRWGRKWHELAELIARMAERPALAEVRRILRANKAAIEAQLKD